MSGAGTRVEAAPRLAQWRVDTLPCYTYRKSDPFRVGLWNWYISVERNNKQTSVKLFAELSNSAKNTAPAPIASFVAKLLISFPPNQKIIVHPGIFDKHLKHDGFLWTIDSSVTGRFVIEIEFLDLKVADPSGGEPASVWASNEIRQSSDNTALSSLARMLQEGILCDITINADDGSIRAHRAILATRSPVFRSMFSHDLKEKELATVDISDMSLDACRGFLNYIYGDLRNEEFLTHRLALLRAADKYDIADLKEACLESLLEDIDTGNVIERLQTGHLYRLQRLKDSCLRFLVDFRKVYEMHDESDTTLQSTAIRFYSLHRIQSTAILVLLFSSQTIIFHTIRLILCYSKPVRLTTSLFRWGKVLWLCCAGSTLAPESLVLRRITFRHHQPSTCFLAPPGSIKPWFLSEGKLDTVRIIPSSWGSQRTCTSTRIREEWLPVKNELQIWSGQAMAASS